ncbi:MAG: hypothetical protein JSW34_03300 [Candidatus Zixiibacteriota bacterium]|nr:MAG: hypothetical protein JSW34_03300 [candidate division Zixibacteria bacterium]
MPENEPLSTLVRLAENERSRIYGKYRGTVRDISDPEDLGRIKAEVPAVYMEGLSPWAMPCLAFGGASHGLTLLPEVGDGVWIEFEGGDIARPIWSGCFWTSEQRPQPKGEKIRLLATSAGHQLILDEDADEMKLVHPGGAELKLGSSEIVIALGQQEIKITKSEISFNNGMVKVTTSGASLVNDAFKVGG